MNLVAFGYTMSDIFLYAKRVEINLSCNELEVWGKQHDNKNSKE